MTLNEAVEQIALLFNKQPEAVRTKIHKWRALAVGIESRGYTAEDYRQCADELETLTYHAPENRIKVILQELEATALESGRIYQPNQSQTAPPAVIASEAEALTRAAELAAEQPRPKVCAKHPQPVHYDEPECPACRMIGERNIDRWYAAREKELAKKSQNR
jgi:hypothetical protein